MNRKDLEDVALTVIVTLCCPFAIFLPPFKKLLEEECSEED